MTPKNLPIRRHANEVGENLIKWLLVVLLVWVFQNTNDKANDTANDRPPPNSTITKHPKQK